MKLRAKIIAGLVTFSLFCTLPLLGVFLSKQSDMKKSTLDRTADIARTLNDKIDRNLFERYGDVQAFAANTAAYDSANWANPQGPLVSAINAYMTNYGLYKLSLYVDLDGNVRAVNSVTPKGEALNTSGYYSKNFSETLWFKNVKEGKFLEGRDGLTGTYVEGPYVDEALAKLYGDDGRVIVFAAQVKDSSGNHIGYWANFASFSLVNEIIDAEYQELKALGFVNTEVTLLDKNGVVIDELDAKDGVLAEAHDVEGMNLVEKAYAPAVEGVAGKSGSIQVPYFKDAAIEKVVGYNHSDGAYGYVGLGWTILVQLRADEVFASIDAAMLQMELVIGGIMLAALAISFYLGGAFSRPIQKMTETMRKLSDGDTSVEVPSTENKDEIGDMAKAVLVFKENMIQSEQMRAEQEQQKIRSEAEKRQAMHAMADGFESSVKSVVTEVSASATQMRGNAERLSSLAGETKSNSAIVSSSATTAAQTATQVAAAAEELTAAIGEISAQIQKSSAVANQASSQAESINQSMHLLVDKSNRVGEVIQFITNIASQINLLALNATIESARAGEAGRGFAVVASEVKNLANQTAKATEEIVQQVQSMQEATQGAVASVGEIISIINEISQSTAGVAAAVEEQSAATNEISRNIAHTAQGTNEISRSIGAVEKGADETGNSSRQVLDSAKALSGQAAMLSEKVEEFLRTVRNS
jgi:methyl-accepting chemotaxis protein